VQAVGDEVDLIGRAGDGLMEEAGMVAEGARQGFVRHDCRCRPRWRRKTRSGELGQDSGSRIALGSTLSAGAMNLLMQSVRQIDRPPRLSRWRTPGRGCIRAALRVWSSGAAAGAVAADAARPSRRRRPAHGEVERGRPVGSSALATRLLP